MIPNTIYQIVEDLRKVYSQLEIAVIIKDNDGSLLVNNRRILKFDANFLERQIERFGKDAYNDIYRLWAEYIERRYIRKTHRFKKGPKGYRLTEAQIKFALQNTKSLSQAARFLNVNYNTFKKYARLNGLQDLFEKHKNKPGNSIIKGGFLIKAKLEDIFAGKHPKYSLWLLKQRLIDEMVFEEVCAVCGYRERREFDGKVALTLDFIDGDPNNRKKENMRLICYNCAFNLKGKLSKEVIKSIYKDYKESKAYDEDKEIEDIWNQMNPKEEHDDNDKDDIDNIWKNFNN